MFSPGFSGFAAKSPTYSTAHLGGQVVVPVKLGSYICGIRTYAVNLSVGLHGVRAAADKNTTKNMESVGLVTMQKLLVPPESEMELMVKAAGGCLPLKKGVELAKMEIIEQDCISTVSAPGKRKIEGVSSVDQETLSKRFILDTDASNYGIGAVLSQISNDGSECVIAYASRSLGRKEQRYCVTRRKLLAIYRGVRATFSTIPSGPTVYVENRPWIARLEKGSKYVLVEADCFTKWVEAYGIPKQEAVTVAVKLVDEMLCRFSPPEQVHSDQGRQFESVLLKEVSNLLQINTASASKVGQN
ncbi:hypothetical protein EMCRGX_G004580 [Ephydatia muelleri]